LIQRDEPHGEIGGNVLKSKRFCGGFWMFTSFENILSHIKRSI
jgi:hypothetical protein